VSLVGNDLTIQDSTAGGAPDNHTIQSDTANSQFLINDPDNILTTVISGATGSGTHALTIPFGAIAGIVINTLAQGDSVTIDVAPGNFAVPIQYTGGDPTSSPGDSLTLTGGGTFANLVVTMTGSDSGTIDVTGNSMITFAGLEPVSSSITATNVTLNYSSTAETLTVATFGVLGKTQFQTSLSEDVDFNNPIGTLTINAGATNADTVEINSLGSGFAGSLTVNGGGGADTINLNTDLAFSGGSVALSGQVLNIDGSISTTGSGSISLIATSRSSRIAG
jgi:hypothetical protein